MKHLLQISMGMTLIATLITGCGEWSSQTRHRSVYHWKTTFSPTPADLAFLRKHAINRIYLRMFDVATEQNEGTDDCDIVPIATTAFKADIPEKIEIVPVTYTTIEALRAMAGKETEYATLIVERLLAMSSYNRCGKIKEIQLDCDWTSSTKGSYTLLCRTVKDILQKKKIALSVTVRLHQLQETAPPAAKGVLMLYNTGALKDIKTANSILDIKNITPYIKKRQYPLPLAYAFPTFGWGVKFKNGKFVSITTENEPATSPDEHIRQERPTAAQILEVKKLVETHLGKPAGGNILYHWDDSQLKNYTCDEIDEIFAD